MILMGCLRRESNTEASLRTGGLRMAASPRNGESRP